MLQTDRMTEISTHWSRKFDFDEEVMASPVYLRSRNLNSNAGRASQPPWSPGSPEAPDSSKSRLFAAIRSGNYQAVKLLLRHGGDANQVDSGGLTPLHRCSYLVSNTIAPRIAALLVRHGADIDSHRLGSGVTPLCCAAQRGNLTMVKTLVGMGANLTIAGPLGSQAIHAAVQFDHCEVVEYLLDEASERDASLVLVAASHFDEQALKRDNSCNLLHSAAMGDAGANMIDLLVRKGVNPHALSANSRSPMFYAIHHGNSAAVLQLSRHGADVVPFIIDAAESESLESFLEVVENNIDLDSRNPDGRTAASMCAENSEKRP